MAIAGIEGLAQGLIQGMALKRQNDRQDVLDAQNLEKFGMDKERFATQQAASAFELQNAQTNAANAAMDRTRNLRIQANQDAFDVKMKRLLSTGDDNLATLAEVEKVHIEDGVKGAFQRDPKTGVILTDEKGFATWINADGSPPQKHTGDSARKLFFEKQYPKEAMTREITNADTIASENRKEKTTIAAEERAAKIDAAKASTQHGYKIGEIKETGRQSRLNVKPEKETPYSATDLKALFTEEYEVGTDANGLPKMGSRINRQLQNRFLIWATNNGKKASPLTYQLWVSSDPAAQSLSLNNKNQDIIGAGVLKGYAAPDTSGGAGVDVSDFNSANQVNAGGNPQKPTGLSIPKVTATATYDKMQRLSENMRSPNYQKYTESMPNEIPVEATQKTDMDGGLYYELLASKKYPSPPDGFMRKSNNYRSPDYNVFVSNSTGFASSN